MKKSALLSSAAALLALAGCTTSSLPSSSSEPTPSDLGTAPQGSITTKNGYQALVNGASYVDFDLKNDGKYGVEVRLAENDEVISYNELPLMLKVRGADSGLMASYTENYFSGAYSTITSKTFGYECVGSVTTTGGSVFRFVDNYYISYKSGIALDRTVTVTTANAQKDVGFASIYSLINAEDDMDVENFQFLLPSILYKDTSNMPASAIANTLTLDKVYVKETRMGVPMCMAFSTETKYYTSLSHADPKIGVNGLISGGGSGAYDNRIQFGSFGFNMIPVAVDFCYPCSEGPVTYDAGATWSKRYHPVEENNSHAYKLAISAGKTDNFNDALVESVEDAYVNLKSTHKDYDNETAYAQAIAAFQSEYREFGTGSVKCAGLPWELKLDRSLIQREYSFQMGFVGMQTSVGANLYHQGLLSNNAEMRRKGETIINFWTSDSAQANYFPYVWWDAGNGNAAGGRNRDYACYIRCMCDGMEGILDAYRYGMLHGISNASWLTCLTTFADRFIAKQNADGSFYRAYTYGGNVAINSADSKLQGDSKLNTPVAIRFLAKMYKLTQQDKYKNAVLRAAEFSYEELYTKLGKYVGGTPDNPNVLDKEAAIYAMYGFTYAYELTQDERFKKAMIHAACCSMTWTFMYDFACPSSANANTNPFQNEGHMIGFSIIATGHGAADNFSSFIWFEFYRVFALTGLDYFKDAAILLQHCSKGSTDYDGEFGYFYNCMCPEATRVSDFNFVGVMVWLPWCSIAEINPIINLYSEYGVWQLEDIGSNQNE